MTDCKVHVPICFAARSSTDGATTLGSALTRVRSPSFRYRSKAKINEVLTRESGPLHVITCGKNKVFAPSTKPLVRILVAHKGWPKKCKGRALCL
jgi:hypothetical protein